MQAKYSKSTRATRKTRVWAGIYYPDSPDDNPYAAIEQSHVPCVCSPRHDQDEWSALDEKSNPDHKAGMKKKAHYHYMFMFPGPVRASVAQDVAQEAFGTKSPTHMEAVNSPTAMARYFAHLDDPDKHQYDPNDIRSFNGAAVELTKPLTREDTHRIKSELTDWCRSVGCTEYQDLVDYAQAQGPDYFDVASGSTFYFSHYIGSIRNRALQNRK